MVTVVMNEAEVWRVLRDVPDPEIPVISICDLGIVRDVKINDSAVTVTITPTYSGCPAMAAIKEDIEQCLQAVGFAIVNVATILSPPWSTDWISPAGRDKLRLAGIAPPGASIHAARSHAVHFISKPPLCPLCRDRDTELLSQFGSTACKALYRCRVCREPFDYFKPL